MLLDANDLQNGEVLTAAIAIVGAGAAGITIARDLRSSGQSVLVLESGGLEPEPETQALYEGRSTGLDPLEPGDAGNAARFGALSGCRLRYFGGTTNHWGGTCRPLDPEDFESWPIDATDLEPFYRQAQATCELGAFDYDSAGIADRLGLPTLALDAERIRTVIYQLSPPTRFGDTYRADLEAATDVRVVLHANLVEVIAAESGAVDRLAGATLSGTTFAVRADRYVLALGGIENARMLLASARESGGVGNDTGHVGRGFMEHPHLPAVAIAMLDAAIDPGLYATYNEVDTFDESGSRVALARGALALSPAARSDADLPNLACTLDRLDPEVASPDLIEPLGSLPIDALATPGTDNRLYSVTLRGEQRPSAASSVRLAAEMDALGVPRAELHWTVEPPDLTGYQLSLEAIASELGRAGIGRLWLREDPEGALAPQQIAGGCHHLGTTRMSTSPNRGVVDANGRVHEVTNLFVAGSSVFASGGYANPTLTIVALAHRLAQHLGARV